MKLSKLEIILISIIGILICVIFTGTIFGLSKKNSDDPQITISKNGVVSLNAPKKDAGVTYFDLGSIRIVTKPDTSKKDDTGTAMVITPWISYPEGDSVFYEELARKKGAIRGIFTAYFTNQTKKQLLETSETTITDELQQQINDQLSLGKISSVYFTDYIFLD